MTVILWTDYQIDHITTRHQVTAEEFEQAWLDRDEPMEVERIHPRHGPYCEGFGYTDSGRCLYMVWRWQHQDEESEEVWPITAYEWEDGEDIP